MIYFGILVTFHYLGLRKLAKINIVGEIKVTPGSPLKERLEHN